FVANNNFQASSSSVMTLTVNPAQTTTILKPDNNPSVFGDSVTFTVTVTPESASTLRPVVGSVSIVDTTTGTTLGSGFLNLNGKFSVTTAALAVGTHAIKATFTGSSGRYATGSGTVDQEVDPISTTTKLTTSGSPSSFGDSVPFTAFVDASPNANIPTGSVVFNVDGNDVSTKGVDGTGHATYTTATLVAGLHPVFARYVSDTVNFSNSTSGNVNQDVSARNTTTMLTSSDSNSFPGESVTFTATVSSQGSSLVPTGSVTFKIDGGNSTVVGLDNMGKATLTTSTLSLGQHTITADYTNTDGNFANSSATPL